jgi:NAD(P)-dependent dehydrogenase (short-subunit alcohol dehydrogenase family)
MDNLEDRVAVVTGGGSGIGRGTAYALAREGVKLVVVDIDAPGAETTANTIRESGREAIALSVDVGEDDAFERIKTATLDRFGRVDIVMNNVGVITRGLPDHIPLEEWQRILNVNLLSVVRSNLAFLPLLIEQGDGHIINTASFAGLYTYAFDRLPYAAGKAAIVQISEGLRLYLAPKGVGVTCLCPGPVATNIMASMRAFGPETETRGPGAMFGLKNPDEVGDQVVDAIRRNRFMLPTDEQVTQVLIERATDWDGFLDRQIARTS